jgi:phage tail protein X
MIRCGKLLLCAVAISAAALQAVEAGERASCEEFYVTRTGDNFANIAARAYAAPMALLISSRNFRTADLDEPLPEGTELSLPCLHELPQYTPHLEFLGTAPLAQVAAERMSN